LVSALGVLGAVLNWLYTRRVADRKGIATKVKASERRTKAELVRETNQLRATIAENTRQLAEATALATQTAKFTDQRLDELGNRITRIETRLESIPDHQTTIAELNQRLSEMSGVMMSVRGDVTILKQHLLDKGA